MLPFITQPDWYAAYWYGERRSRVPHPLRRVLERARARASWRAATLPIAVRAAARRHPAPIRGA